MMLRGMPRTDAFVVMVRRSLKVRPLIKKVARIRFSTVETVILLLKYRTHRLAARAVSARRMTEARQRPHRYFCEQLIL